MSKLGKSPLYHVSVGIGRVGRDSVLSKTFRLSPEIVSFVLRNSPLRVVRVSRIIGDDAESPKPKLPGGFAQSSLVVTLEAVVAEHAHLTRERLQQIPDNQLLLFWTETASFSISGPIEEENHTYADSHFFRYEIRDGNGHVVGQTDLCVPGDAEDVACALGEGVFEFILLARVATQVAAAEKLALLIERRDGIAYRVTAANISEEAWTIAKPRMELVVLG